MLLFLFINLVTFLVQASPEPEWIKKIPAPTNECQYIIGIGRSDDSSSEGELIASKRSLHDGYVKILEEMKLVDFQYELKTISTNDEAHVEETGVENYPLINSSGIKVINNFWEKHPDGLTEYKLICFNKTKIKTTTKDQLENKTHVDVMLDSFPYSSRILINGHTFLAPVLYNFKVGEKYTITFRYKEDKTQTFEYIPTSSENNKLKIFQLKIIWLKPKRPLPIQPSSPIETEEKSQQSTGDQHLGIAWDLDVGFLSKTINKGKGTTSLGTSLRYELIQDLEIGMRLESGKFESQSDEIKKYSYLNYAPEIKYLIPFEYSVFNNRSLISPYLKYQYMTWNQSVTQRNANTGENEKSFKSHSNNFSTGLELRSNTSNKVRIFGEFKRIQFTDKGNGFNQSNANALVLGLGTDF